VLLSLCYKVSQFSSIAIKWTEILLRKINLQMYDYCLIVTINVV